MSLTPSASPIGDLIAVGYIVVGFLIIGLLLGGLLVHDGGLGNGDSDGICGGVGDSSLLLSRLCCMRETGVDGCRAGTLS